MCVKNKNMYAWSERAIIREIATHDLYCCLLPRCKALRTCRSGFPIASLPKYLIWSGLYLKKALIKHYTAVINAVWITISDPVEFFLIQSHPVSSKISDVCDIFDLLLFFGYFASQNKEITSGNSFFDVCCVNQNILVRCQVPTTSYSTGIIFTIENFWT